MYNLMIVDDDRLVRKRIQSAIPFDKLGLQLCAEAENGIQALELFEQYHPQIVIMDINIPFINGIDVSKRILESNDDVNIVIVTGYGTVDFAKEAIRGGMVDFLLKPVDFAELNQTLRRIVLDIQNHTAQTLEGQRMERLLERGMPLLRSSYFQSLMSRGSETMDEEDCRLYLKDFGITGDISAICTAIVCPSSSDLSVNEQLPRQAVLEEQLNKEISEGGGCIVLNDTLHRAILVAYGAKGNLDAFLEQKLSVVRDRMRYLYQYDFHASIGSVVPEFRQLRKSYMDAEKALNFWNVFGSNNIVSFENVRLIESSGESGVFMRHSDMMNLVSSGDAEKLRAAMTDFLNRLVCSAQSQLPVLQQKTVELVALMVNCAEELGGTCACVAQENPYAKIMFSDSIGKLRSVLERMCDAVLSELGSRREQTGSRAIASAKRYIREHYNDPELNLSRVAEQVQLSPSYVSQLFRKDESRGFTDYINYVRVEEAKKLLRQTNLRVYEVAEMVGYQNSKYFFQVFKQLTGKRPREFFEDAAEKDRNVSD